MLNRGLDKVELLRIVEAVANEKSIDKEIVLESMESAIQKAALAKFGSENNIRVSIDRLTGDIKIQKVLDVVEKVEDSYKEIILNEAQSIDKNNKDLKVGDQISEDLPQIDFGRIAAQSAKQVISLRVKEAEKNRQYEDFVEKQGQILSGIIKRLEYGNVIVDLGKAEGVIKKDELIPREILKTGDRVKAYCYEVKKELKGHQIFLSRAHPQFLAKLFFQEVPEIYEGIIEIKAVARDPGSRAKICVSSNESSIDPVGACVGMRGSRVQAVVGELQGEKIEIIPWSDDPVSFVINALAPAVPSKVVMDEDAGRMEVVVPDDQLSLAIGRRGQNVRLASQLTGWYVDILTEAEESGRRQEEFAERTKIFIDALDIDDVIAHLMVGEGFVSIEDIADASLDELVSIEGFDEGIASELSERAKNYIKVELERVEKSLKKLKINDDLYNFDQLSKQSILILAENKIKTLDELAELDSEELFNILGKDVFVNEEEAGSVIMSAREHWFSDENLDN